MEKRSRRPLRSASVQLGALTALALTVSGCNLISDDDDDCALGHGDGAVVAVALRAPSAGPTARDRATDRALALPERGGFGTHLASCGG